MFESIEEYLERNQASDDRGSSIYEHEIRRALNHALNCDCLSRFLAKEYKIRSCNRVLYSSQNNWIDILIQLVNDSNITKNIIITYESDTNKFIAATEIYENPKTLDGNASGMPFALATRSYADTVKATDEQMRELSSRRHLFMKGIVAALMPVMGIVSPAMAATTTFSSTSGTQSTKSQQTSEGTSGVTTPGDNDTRSDTKIDTVTDTTPDTTQDSREDP
ncbi:hypothetical protein [Methylosinus sporium]|uniref:hypothetical protein n=1 Tax=Methylosinus sporium TaxID=428 RepID=UPI00383AFBED